MDRDTGGAEPGAAAPLAALLTGAYVPRPDERVALVICGGNADPADLTESRSIAARPTTKRTDRSGAETFGELGRHARRSAANTR